MIKSNEHNDKVNHVTTFKNGPILYIVDFLICEERNSTTIINLFTIFFLDINLNSKEFIIKLIVVEFNNI